MLGDDGLESKDDVRVFSLIVLARFVPSAPPRIFMTSSALSSWLMQHEND